MKKLITLSFFLVAVFLFSALAVTQSSCQKNTTCNATISVVDTTGTGGVQVPVVGATVYLSATGYKGPGQVTGNATTDNNGNVYITGYTTSGNGIATKGAFQTSIKGLLRTQARKR